MKKMTSFGRFLIKLRTIFIPDGPMGDRARGILYEPYLKKCGDNFKVASGAFIYNPSGLSVGKHVYVGFGSYIGAGEVVLEDEVLIGNHVSITASNHVCKNHSYRFGGSEGKPIKIGKGSWLGGHSCILAGVKVPKGSVVAAGAVVTKSVKGENVLIAGVPAKVVKEYQ